MCTPGTNGRIPAGSTCRALFASERLAVSMWPSRSRTSASGRGDIGVVKLIGGPSQLCGGTGTSHCKHRAGYAPMVNGGSDDYSVCHPDEACEALSDSRAAAVRRRPVDHLLRRWLSGRHVVPSRTAPSGVFAIDPRPW